MAVAYGAVEFVRSWAPANGAGYPGPMTTADVLSIALDDVQDPPLRPLPAGVAELLGRVGAPARLVAHLRAVHDVALQIVDRVGSIAAPPFPSTGRR